MMVLMGEDFRFENATINFEAIDFLIDNFPLENVKL
jgi:hypothetical protein